MPTSPKSQRKSKRTKPAGFNRNDVRKQLSFSGKKKSPNRNKLSYQTKLVRSQNLLSRLEKIMND